MQNRSIGKIARIGILSASLFVGLQIAVFGQSLIWLGTLGGSESAALDVSADGTVVVGWARNSAGQKRAFRWCCQSGLQDLGTLGGSESWANGVSADGRVVVGAAKNSSNKDTAFRWLSSTGMQSLGLSSIVSAAADVSADGSVIVGNKGYKAFRWENGVVQDIFYTAYCRGSAIAMGSKAYGTSLDGRRVVGWSNRPYDSDCPLAECAFSWVNGNLRFLGECGWDSDSVAVSISANGVAVGYLLQEALRNAIRWANNTAQYLIPGYPVDSAAYDVTADGATVVGEFTDYNQSPVARAFRWQGGSWTDLNADYASLLADGSILHRASAISYDGRYIVGTGYNAQTQRTEAFLLDTWCNPADVNGDGIADDADLVAILTTFGTPGSGYTRHEDINKDGVVDDADLLTVLLYFGAGC